jgi:AcrR family transcriptional regulator
METHENILKIARRLFTSQGYTATSIRQIAEEAGIGKATVYHHFTDKQAILEALLAQSSRQSPDVFRNLQAGQDPHSVIRAATQASLNYLFENADLLQMVRREVPELRHKMMADYGVFFKAFSMLISESLQRGRQAGVFREMDPSLGTRVLLTMIQGTFALTFMSGEPPLPAEEASAPLLDIFFRGIENRVITEKWVEK